MVRQFFHNTDKQSHKRGSRGGRDDQSIAMLGMNKTKRITICTRKLLELPELLEFFRIGKKDWSILVSGPAADSGSAMQDTLCREGEGEGWVGSGHDRLRIP